MARNTGRHGDATLILVAYRHVLRVLELVSQRWDQLDLAYGDTPYMFVTERGEPVQRRLAAGALRPIVASDRV